MIDGQKVCFSLRNAYLAMHRKADASLQSSGITSNQFVVLSALAEEDGISQRALVERVSSDPNTIRPILASLEEKGLIVREPSNSDGRIWEVKLTRKGRTAFSKTSVLTNSFHQAVISGLSNAESDTLVGLLQKVADAVNAHTPPKAAKRAKATRRTPVGAGK